MQLEEMAAVDTSVLTRIGSEGGIARDESESSEFQSDDDDYTEDYDVDERGLGVLTQPGSQRGVRGAGLH